MSLLSTILLSLVAFATKVRSDVLMDDIMLTDEQHEGLLLRKGIFHGLWSSPVKYYIGSEFVQRDADEIYRALDHVEANTCIQFEEICEAPPEGDFLWFFKGGGCWSYLGNAGFGTNGQGISIGDGCAWMWVVVHEIGHALGFLHEQSRSDRDDHITVLFENIQDGGKGQYGKWSQDGSRGVPYDLYSVMHYKSSYFSTGGRTMVPKNLLGVQIMGENSEGLSTYDKKLANIMYNCEADLENECGFSCNNSGLLTKEGCSCECVPGTSGSTCEIKFQDYVDARSDQLKPYKETSGGVFGFDAISLDWNPNILKLHVKPESSGDAMRCASIDIVTLTNVECDVGYAAVNITGSQEKYCGENPAPPTVTSSNWEMKVVVITNHKLSLKVGFVDC